MLSKQTDLRWRVSITCVVGSIKVNSSIPNRRSCIFTWTLTILIFILSSRRSTLNFRLPIRYSSLLYFLLHSLLSTLYRLLFILYFELSTLHSSLLCFQLLLIILLYSSIYCTVYFLLYSTLYCIVCSLISTIHIYSVPFTLYSIL